MGIYYHGSAVKGLSKLIPQKSKYSKLEFPYVYLTENIQKATLYIWNRPYYWMYYGFNDNIPFITETFKNGLFELYNLDGYIYEVDGTFETDGRIGILYTKISKEPINVKKQHYIKNVYKKLLEYEEEGTVIIKRYEELSEKDIETRDRLILGEIKIHDLKNNEDDPYSKFIMEKFLDIWNMN